jgi:hypothetical protein
VTNAPSLAVATTTLPGGTAGSSYLAALGATGGMQAYAWSVVSGTLPAGLALSSTGVLSGTPTTAGTSRFTVQVRDSSPSPQTAQASVSVTVASSSTLSVMTTALPAGVAGTAYSATLGAEGGKAPYTWSMTSGSLPTGLTLSSGGIVSGTPTTAGSTSATFQVQDSSSTPLSVQATITLTVTSAVSGLTAVDSTSSNWSGYAETGTSFTHATGTFTIPSIVANGAVGDTSEWVGIDGTGNSDLIQAGVDEEVDAGSSTASIWAWWEILPAYATPVTLPVSAGDTVTVSIDELSAGEWKISIFDVTSGDDFTIEQAYSGPGTSAEWIVEAPTSGSTSSVVTLLDYTPAVTFTELGVTGSASGLYRIVLDQNSQAVSTPSALDATGFVVQYGSTTPSPP